MNRTSTHRIRFSAGYSVTLYTFFIIVTNILFLINGITNYFILKIDTLLNTENITISNVIRFGHNS